MIKMLSYIVFVASLIFISFLISQKQTLLPQKIMYQDFSRNNLYTYGLQASYVEIFNLVKKRKLNFEGSNTIEIKKPHYFAKIRVEPENAGLWRRYHLQMYYQVPIAMLKPLVVESSFVDHAPKDTKIRVKDFSWEFR